LVEIKKAATEIKALPDGRASAWVSEVLSEPPAVAGGPLI
jgi:hypothetical protein